MRLRLEFCAFALVSLLATATAFAYDPLSAAESNEVATQDFTVNDSGRHREIPVRVYLPQEKQAAPVLLFSHGLGGSRQGSGYLGRHWASRGYVVVCLQHAGSDTSVWQDQPPAKRMAALKEAASVRNFLLRVKDVPAVLDQLERWNKTEGHALAGRLDLSRVGMSGHSFGAVTTQAVSGQSMAPGLGTFADPRIKAAMAFSPSSPQRGKPEIAFSSVKIPWMLMTGTKDIAPIGPADLASRLSVFPALPPGGKYELILDGAAHSVFSDRPVSGEGEKRNPNHHRAILALSTAFWDAWLRGEPEAKAWLDGKGPRTVLEPKDQWQRK